MQRFLFPLTQQNAMNDWVTHLAQRVADQAGRRIELKQQAFIPPQSHLSTTSIGLMDDSTHLTFIT